MAVSQGEVPLWNRYNASGRPLWGQGLAFLLDPFHWLTMGGVDPALGWDIKFVIHRVVFAMGVGLLSAAATGAMLPTLVVTAASAFGGIYTYRFNHPAILALTYAPWVLLAWMRLLDAKERRQEVQASVWLAVSTALLLVASTPKEASVMLLGVETAGALAVVLTRAPWRLRVRRLVAAALAGAAAMLLTMPHWLVFFQTLRQSFTLYDKPYVNFAGRLEAVGFFLSPVTPGGLRPGLHLFALLLLIAVCVAPRRLLASPIATASMLVASGLMLVAFGAVPASVLVKVPLLGNIGHIDDAFVTAALPLLLVTCAIGAAALLEVAIERIVLVTVVAAAAMGWLFANVRHLAPDGGFESLALLVLVPLVLAVPGCFYFARTAHARSVAAVATGCACLVLMLPSGLHADSGLAVVDQLLLQPRPRTELDTNSPAVDAIHSAAKEPARTIGVDWALFAGSQALYELEGIGGADPLELPEYRQLIDAAGVWRNWGWFTMVRQSDLARLSPLLDMLNVRFVLSRPDNAPDALARIAVSGPDRLVVTSRPTAWPRAFFVDGVTTYANPQELIEKVAAAGRPIAAVQYDDRRALEATQELAQSSGRPIPATGYRLSSNTTDFIVRATGSGVAVLTESYLSDDFRATLNGRRVQYFRVNHAFKGVAIPSAGDWHVKFEYRPVGWDVSVSVAGATLVLLGAFALPKRPRATSRPGAAGHDGSR
jgi:hypothetical protein